MSKEDPFSKYGGRAIQDEKDDPFAKYGGSAVAKPVAPTAPKESQQGLYSLKQASDKPGAATEPALDVAGIFRKALDINAPTGTQTERGNVHDTTEFADPYGLLGMASPTSILPGMGRVAGILKGSAEKSMAQVLGATTKESKAITAKVVPELIDRGMVAATRKGFEKKAASALSAAGDKIDEVLAAIPEGVTADTRPILKAMNNYRNTFRVEGSKVIANEPGFQNATEQMKKLAELVQEQGRDVSFKSLRSLRQILDTTVSNAKGFFGKTVAEGSKLDAQRELAGAIRSELAKTQPDLAKINAEYAFWKKVDKVLKETIERTQSQATPLSQTIGTAAGAVVGATHGGVVSTVAAGRYLPKLFQSTGWRTVSAQTKNTLAEMLADGSTKQADLLARVILAGKAASSTQIPRSSTPSEAR